jgi:hypothetical protein
MKVPRKESEPRHPVFQLARQAAVARAFWRRVGSTSVHPFAHPGLRPRRSLVRRLPCSGCATQIGVWHCLEWSPCHWFSWAVFCGCCEARSSGNGIKYGYSACDCSGLKLILWAAHGGDWDVSARTHQRRARQRCAQASPSYLAIVDGSSSQPRTQQPPRNLNFGITDVGDSH